MNARGEGQPNILKQEKNNKLIEYKFGVECSDQRRY